MNRHNPYWFYLLAMPAVVGMVIFHIAPLVGGFLFSYFDWPFPQPPTFVGWENYQTLTGDDVALRAVINTLLFSLGTVIPGLVLGVALASLLLRIRHGIYIYRMIFFLPFVTSGVATAIMWSGILNPRYGGVNIFLDMLGISGPRWLTDENWALLALMFIHVWNVGVNVIVYETALRNVPQDALDAALIDGANWWTRFRYVSWPLIGAATLFLLIVNFVGTFQTFTSVYVLTDGGPNNATLTLAMYIFQNAFTWGKIGYGAALATLFFLIIGSLTALQFRFTQVYYRGLEPSI